jgi:exonuclease SbcC
VRIERISARGLKGLSLFASGVAFDFDQLPPGLIAVVGPNGNGKTTFLELPIVALYGKFPSRPDNALVGSVTGRDAFIDLEAAFDGRGTYRARVSVDEVGRSTDAVLQLVKPDGTATTLNDGKVSTFRQAIARELPPLELVLASAFAAQGRTGSFATLGKKERKDLFSALLGLDHYEQLATTARAAAGDCTRRLDQLRGQLEALRPLTAPSIEDEISETGNRLQVQLNASELERPQLVAAIERLTRRVDELQKQNARYVAAAAEYNALAHRRLNIAGELPRLTDELQRLSVDEAADATAILRRRDQDFARIDAAIALLPTPEKLDASLERQIADLTARLSSAVAERTEKISNNRTILLDRAADIRAAAAATQAATERIESVRAQEEVGRRDLAQLQQRETAARERRDHALAEVQRRQRDAEATRLMDSVPCGGATPYDACQFLQQAAAARDRLAAAPLISAQLEHQEAETALTRAKEAVEQASSTLSQLTAAIAAQQQVIATHAVDARRLAALESAETRVKELEDEITQLQRDHAAACDRARADRQDEGRAVDARRQDLQRERTDAAAAATKEAEALTERATRRRQEISERRAAVAADLEDLAVQRAALVRVRDENAAAHADLETVAGELAATRILLADVDRQLARLDVEIRGFETRRAEYIARVGQRRQLEAAIGDIERDLIEWQALARIFGRDGLPVLEIDAAGPAVSDLANDLLQACFGSRFTVQLTTQEPKADGKGFKEVFDLRVFDAERDAEPRDLSDLSGGEQVIVDEALKSAIALFVNHRNVLPLRTCWRDETIGALDHENALRYVAMLRRMRERGGFHHVLFISHNHEAAALADAQIVVAGGRIDVRYPPFAGTPEGAAA